MSRIVGFGAERIELPSTASPEGIAEQRMVMLARCLNMKTTIAFIGAGCSRPLGYPDWSSLTDGAVAAVQATIQSSADSKYDAAARRLAHASGRADRTTDEFLVTLGFCQRVAKDLETDGHGNPFRDYLRTRFEHLQCAERVCDENTNPYVALLRLPIHRFITSNYDLELERAITLHGSDDERARYGLAQGAARKGPHLSFTQTEEYVRELSGFAFAFGETPRTVFHCHGRYDEIDSMIITEDDYQRWYLGKKPAGEAFRQNLELIFGSNPIFFVGFGMRDNDLLHALRLLNAGDTSRQRPRARSLFALLPASGDEAADLERDDLLYKRYHVHAITYDWRGGADAATPTPEEGGRGLCRKLLALRDRSLEIREEFIRKPLIRKVIVNARPPQPYLHYAVARDGADDLAPDRTRQDLERLKTLVAGDVGIIVIHGYGGSGKSWRAIDLINEVAADRGGCGIDGVFFWSSYYADDWLTGIERLLSYFGSEPAPRLTRMQRVAQCLEGRHLIVFDGFERLLRSHGTRGEPTSAVRAVMQLLEAARCGRSTVVLTTRVMPAMLKGAKRVEEFSMRRAITAELANGNVFGPLVDAKLLTSDDLAAVCSLCDGHSYALALAAAYLRAEDDEKVAGRMDHLRRRLSDASPAHRLTTMIQLAVTDVTNRVGPGAKSLLEKSAIFMSPVTEAMIDVCAGGKSHEREHQALLDARLIFRVTADPDSSDLASGYTVHPMVRNYIFHPESSADLDSVPNFTLSGFTSGSSPVFPGSEQCVDTIRHLFRSMHDEAERALERGDGDRARQLCRGAFSAIRSRMEANSVTRWTTYDDYLEDFEVPLANLVKRVSPAMWDYMDRSHAPLKEDKDGPLFADELAWLWDDIGLALFEQGAMADAHAVWELSYEIDRVTDSYEDGGQYLVQSRLDMTAVFLEMGRLDTAGDYLADTEESNRSYGDEEYAGRVTGYKALLTHLRGNPEEADRLYGAAEEQLRAIGRNLRGRSIFAQHHADLKMSIGDPATAATLIRTSRALAEEGKHFDLIAYARGCRGRLHLLRGEYREAQLEFDAALSEARRLGIRGLEAETLCELGRLALSLGDWHTARARAIASLIIANELWLGLQRSTAMVVLGRAMIEGRNPKLGAAYLHHAWDMTKKQGYLLCAHEAEKELRNLGEIYQEVN